MRLSCDPTAALFVFACMALCAAVIRAAEPDPRERLEKRVFRNPQGESIPYRLFVPKGYDAVKKCPVILFLHGAGERGTDNWSQLLHAEVLGLVSEAGRPPCFLVAPQCPDKVKWVDVPWDSKKPHHTPAQPTAPMRLALELLDALAKEFPIDPARRYVTGLSMGGFGAYDACLRRPGYFAAAVPVCGGADDSRARDFVGTSFWIFHGGSDSVVPVNRSHSIYHLLKAAGANAKYTEYPGIDHNSWSRAYREPGLAEWLFAQHR
jgi:predicted peptidase